MMSLRSWLSFQRFMWPKRRMLVVLRLHSWWRALFLLALASCGGPAFATSPAMSDVDAAELEHGFSDAQSETSSPAADVVDAPAARDGGVDENASADVLEHGDASAAADVVDELEHDASPAADVVDEPAIPACNPGACPCLYEGSVRCCVAGGGITCL